MIDFQYLWNRVRNDRDPSLAIYMIQDQPEVAAAGLDRLAWMIGSSLYQVHRNDCIGLVEDLEKWVNEHAGDPRIEVAPVP